MGPIEYAMCIVMVFGNQISLSTSKVYSCSNHNYSNFTNVTIKEIKCFVEKDFILIEGISKHIAHIKTYLDTLRAAYGKLSKLTSQFGDKHEYLGNALNVFSLIQRPAKDWFLPITIALHLPVSFNSIQGTLKDFDRNNLQDGSVLDTEIDLTSAYSGITRLQNMYHITAASLADGEIAGANTHTRMTTDECFEFAKQYYFKELNYHKAMEWLDQAQARLNRNKKIRVTEKAILELYFLAQCFTGDFMGSKLTYEKLVSKYQKFSPSLQLLEDFEIIAKYGCKKAGKIAMGRKKFKDIGKRGDKVGVEDFRNAAFKDHKEQDPKLFELCNDPHNSYYGTAKLLKCRYIHFNHPALKIGSFKLEEYHLDPPILLFHDVISDAEIAELIIRNKPLMRISNATDGVPHYGTATAEAYGGRTESVWVRDVDSNVVARLARRAAMFSGCSTGGAEPFQLVSYGVAAGLPPHVDYMSEEKKRDHPQYADYSTITFHLSNVDKGGYTIFPELNLTVVPVKGSALLWFNRKPDGTSDELSVHASCPVLQGFKWTLNKWFHMDLQSFPRCSQKKNSSFKYYYLQK